MACLRTLLFASLSVGLMVTSFATAEAARLVKDRKEAASILDDVGLRDSLSGGLSLEEAYKPASASVKASQQSNFSKGGQRAGVADAKRFRIRRDEMKDALREEGEKIRGRRAPRFTHGIID